MSQPRNLETRRGAPRQVALVPDAVATATIVVKKSFVVFPTGAGLWQGHFDDVRDLYFIPYDIEDKYNSAYNAFLLFWTYIILFQVGRSAGTVLTGFGHS